MCKLICCLLFLSCNYLKAQLLPFIPTKDSALKQMSLMYTRYAGKYDAVITQSKNCYWPKEQQFYLVGYKQGKWELLSVYVKFKTHHTDNDKIKRVKEKRMSLNGISIDSMLNHWTQMGFWTFDTDSLNCKSKISPNGDGATLYITDGCYYGFEAFSKNNYYSTGAYNPVQYQEFVYILQREKFLKCWDKFKEIAH